MVFALMQQFGQNSELLTLRELLGHLMPSELYMFIPFLKTKNQMGQTRNWSIEKLQKKDYIIATILFEGK